MSPHINYLVGLEHSTKKWEMCTQLQFSVLPAGALPNPNILEVFHIIGKLQTFWQAGALYLKIYAQ